MIKGVYIHIPFCSMKCPYCDFTSVTVVEDSVFSKYVDLLKKELLMYKKDGQFKISSIYFGGGTPSVLPPHLIGDLVSFIKEEFPYGEKIEITVELNPENYRYRELSVLKEAGVNRLSIGAQSFLVKNLKALGRTHTPEDIAETVYDAVRAGFENISLDMIYGIQGQTEEDLKEDLKIYTSLPVQHISAYMLTAYDETPLGQMVKKSLYNMPDDEKLNVFFKLINTALENKGFTRYELSNWSKKDYQCRHNLLYWKREEFLGIGVSAWSFINNVRFGNTKNIYEYMKRVEKGEKPVIFRDFLDEEGEIKEKIFLGLRLSEGISLDLVKDKMNFIKGIVEEGFAEIEDDRLKLTPDGILLSNYISAQLI